MAITSTTQPSVRARSRNPNPNAGNASPAQQNPGATADWMTTGAAAIEGHQKHQEYVAQRREERQAEYGVPYRLFLPKGDEVDAIILDNDFGPGLYEHDLTFNDRFKRVNPKNGRPIEQYVTSPRQWEVDPLEQEVGLSPSYNTYLTIDVLRPWTDKNGTQHAYQRRLVSLKGDAMEMMSTIRAQQVKAGHVDAPLRGVHVVFKRGNGDQSLRTGLPVFVERCSEKDIMETFSHPAIYTEKDNKLVKVENEDCYPIDYARAFPKPSAEAIRLRFNLGAAGGGSGLPGSSGYSRNQFDDGNSGTGTGGFGGSTIRSAASGASGAGEGGTGGEGGSTGNGFADDLDDDIPF